MTATLTLDEAGRLLLPQAVVQMLGVKPGAVLTAEVTRDRIELIKNVEDVPVMTEVVMKDGLLVLAPTGIAVDAAAAVRAERDALADRCATPQTRRGARERPAG